MEDEDYNDSIAFRFRPISFKNDAEEIKYKEAIDKIYLLLFDIAMWVNDSTFRFADYDLFINSLRQLKSDKKTSFLKKARFFTSFTKRSNNEGDIKL